MSSAPDRFQRRLHRVARARAGVWLALACLAAACEIDTGPYTRDIGDLSRADRIEVSVDGSTPVRTITERRKVAAVAAFVSRYRDGWINALSGISAEGYLTFYAGDRRLVRIGVDASFGISDGGFVRALNPDEVKELIALLDIPWPPSELAPGGTADRDKAP